MGEKRRLASNISGERFGRLTAYKIGPPSGRETRWWCLCDCGNAKLARRTTLVSGNVKSCGCLRPRAGCVPSYDKRRIVLRKAMAAPLAPPKPTPLSKAVEYRTWKSMLNRCHPSKGHTRYGLRGIRVCEEWRDYRKFLEDMGRRPSAEHSIERLNVNGNYEKANCVWATRKEQGANTSKTVYVTLDGQYRKLIDVGAEYGLDPRLIRSRMDRGWTIERAVLIPKGGLRKERPITYDPEMVPLERHAVARKKKCTPTVY